MLVIGYLSEHPEKIASAVVVEPAFLYPGAPVKECVGGFQEGVLSFWDIAPPVLAYPFVKREDGQEGWDYVATKVANQNRPGPPYNCEGQGIPPDTFQRVGYEAYDNIFQPIIDNPDSFTDDLTRGITEYHGALMLISSECSILGHKFQETYNLPRLPAQTVHVKAEGTVNVKVRTSPQKQTLLWPGAGSWRRAVECCIQGLRAEFQGLNTLNK